MNFHSYCSAGRPCKRGAVIGQPRYTWPSALQNSPPADEAPHRPPCHEALPRRSARRQRPSERKQLSVAWAGPGCDCNAQVSFVCRGSAPLIEAHRLVAHVVGDVVSAFGRLGRLAAAAIVCAMGGVNMEGVKE
jgi:hypothetical protein